MNTAANELFGANGAVTLSVRLYNANFQDTSNYISNPTSSKLQTIAYNFTIS
jgi:hypothetical protein